MDSSTLALCALLGLASSVMACEGGSDDALSAGDSAASESGSEQDTESGEPEGDTESGEPEPIEPMGERPPLGFACDASPSPTGLFSGDVVPNVVGVDQWGEELSLYDDLCERTVLLVRAGFDCGQCNEAAPKYGELHALYGDQGFIVLTMLHDSYGPISSDQLNLWANGYGLTHPVVLDNDFALSGTYWPGTTARPRTKLLGPGAVVLQDQPTPEDIAALFE